MYSERKPILPKALTESFMIQDSPFNDVSHIKRSLSPKSKLMSGFHRPPGFSKTQRITTTTAKWSTLNLSGVRRGLPMLEDTTDYDKVKSKCIRTARVCTDTSRGDMSKTFHNFTGHFDSQILGSTESKNFFRSSKFLLK